MKVRLAWLAEFMRHLGISHYLGEAHTNPYCPNSNQLRNHLETVHLSSAHPCKFIAKKKLSFELSSYYEHFIIQLHGGAISSL